VEIQSSMNVRDINEVIICYQCGMTLAIDAPDCPYCGMAVVPAAAAAAPVGAPVPGPPSSAPPYAAVASPAALGPELRLASSTEINKVGIRVSRRALAAIGVVALVLIGGGVAYGVLKPAAPSGSVTIRSYFGDLARGDTGQAMTRVSDADKYPIDSFPLLDAKALADEHNRPTDLKITHSDPITRQGGFEVQQVDISYKIGGETVGQTIVAGRAEGAKDFLLASPFLRFTVSNAGSREVTVNGVVMRARVAQSTLAFPGVYTAVAKGTALLAEASDKATVQSRDSSTPVALITLPEPTLAPGARDAITQKVKKVVDTCAESTSPYPDNCPFSMGYLYSGDASVKWKVVSYPTIVLSLSPFGGSDVSIDGNAFDGRVHYDATYTDFTGAPRTDSGEQRFGVRGTATASGSTIAVSIN
jgi:hypothetical protein